MIWKIGDIIFVTSKADKYAETLLAEHNGQRYRIRIDKTMMPYYYEVFWHYYEGERDLHKKIFASSRRSRIEEWLFAGKESDISHKESCRNLLDTKINKEVKK